MVWLHGPSRPVLSQASAKPAWLPEWIDIAGADQRPGKLKEHETGEIYCLDLSSTFVCAAYAEIPSDRSVVVDVCASPGGKGIMARRYLNPKLLVGNEVIGKRTAQLISNYKRCRIDPSIVTSLDPERLGEEIPETADLVIVDAPSSGQSLLLKGMAAPGAFHPATIGMNERRQRRILAHSSKIVASGGFLLYSTCTFSREENENNVEWFLKNFPDFEAVTVRALESYQSTLSEPPCYRLYPQSGVGAGAFCALFRRAGEPAVISPDAVTARLRAAWRSPTLFVSRDTSEQSEHRSAKRREQLKGERERYNRARERHESRMAISLRDGRKPKKGKSTPL